MTILEDNTTEFKLPFESVQNALAAFQWAENVITL